MNQPKPNRPDELRYNIHQLLIDRDEDTLEKIMSLVDAHTEAACREARVDELEQTKPGVDWAAAEWIDTRIAHLTGERDGGGEIRDD